MELDEKLEGRTLYKFERRILLRDPKDIQPAEQIDEDDDETQTAPAAQAGAGISDEGRHQSQQPATE